MRPSRFISVIRPVRLRRGFGLVDAGWPAHRVGRRPVTPGQATRGVPRWFRKKDVLPEVQKAAVPVNLAITNLTLCPQLQLRIAAKTRAVKKVLSHFENVTRRSDIHMEANTLFEMPTARSQETERFVRMNETVLERITRIFLLRHAQPAHAAPRQSTASYRASASAIHSSFESSAAPMRNRPGRRADIPATEREVVWLRQPRRSADAMRRARRYRRIISHPAISPESVFEDTTRRLDRVLRTHVLRRILRLDHRHLDDTVGESVTTTGRRQHSSGHIAAPVSPDHPETMARKSASDPLPRPQTPSPRVFRAEPQRPEPLPAAQTVYPAPPPPPQIDMGRLDRELWQRFEKRMRIEHERRGRG